MLLCQALRLSKVPCLALVGSGGKTTTLFKLARELQPPVITAATAHMAIAQCVLADRHIVVTSPIDLAALDTNRFYPQGITLITGIEQGERTAGLSEVEINWLRAFCQEQTLPLLIEADGSRQRPLKAPADHEPAIPDFAETVIVVVGLSGLDKPLTDETVHRPEIFAELSGLEIGETVTPDALVRMLNHPSGGLKNIPFNARRVVLLNQADSPELQAQAKEMAERLLIAYDSVVVASLGQNQIRAVHDSIAGIILAAGEAKRFGQPKQLLDWNGKSLVQHVAETALSAGLSPVMVVTGASAEAVEASIRELPLTIIHNPDWKNGQSTSLQSGLQSLPPKTGAAIFLLADQPQITPTVLRALVERHSADLSPIVAPQVQGQRANPVLFDRVTFPALMSLTGDVGGRAIFSKFPVTYLPWHDENLLADIDTPEDYKRLMNGE
jgi:molybdenum cofactor cytidylyltransferase